MPEIGDDDPKWAPFVRDDDGLPDFKNISVEKCMRRIGGQSKLLEEQVVRAEELLKASADAGKPLAAAEFFENVLRPIEEADKELSITWGLSKTLYHANDVPFATKHYFSLHQRARRATMSRFYSRPIYESVKQLLQSHDTDAAQLSREQKRVLDVYALKSKVCGLNLTAEFEQGELQYRSQQLVQEQVTYESKVYVAIDHFFHTITDYGVVQAFPPEMLQSIATDSKNPLSGPWKVQLKAYMVDNFLAHCPDRDLRWNVWKSNTQKASRQVRTELDNGIHVETIRDHRNRIRELLGYKDHVQLKRETFHLEHTMEPEALLAQLKTHAKPKQKQEMGALTDFAKQSGFASPLFEEYDVAYWCRKYNVAVNKYDQHLIQEYFPVGKVFTGLFGLAERLFGVRIVERPVKKLDRWHSLVKYFDVFDTSADNASADPIGGFFLDAFSASQETVRYERPHGVVVPIREHSKPLASQPLLSWIFNYSLPLHGKAHTLTLNEVETVFATFGNLLQKLLNESNHRELAGFVNVEYANDVVCSHVFADLLYNDEVLRQISEHISTREPLNDDHIRAIQAQRHTLVGHNLCTELYKSSLDLELHTTQNFWLDCQRKNYGKYLPFEMDKRDARLCSMFDVMIGNWTGCYHGLLYSRLLAADIHKDFEQAIQSNETARLSEVGRQFRRSFLSLGSNASPLDTFRRYAGRDPKLDAFTKQLGLKQSSA